MIDRSKLPLFLQDMPEERLIELMEEDDKASNFDKAMDKMLHADKENKAERKARIKSCLPTISNQ